MGSSHPCLTTFLFVLITRSEAKTGLADQEHDLRLHDPSSKPTPFMISAAQLICVHVYGCCLPISWRKYPPGTHIISHHKQINGSSIFSFPFCGSDISICLFEPAELWESRRSGPWCPRCEREPHPRGLQGRRSCSSARVRRH